MVLLKSLADAERLLQEHERENTLRYVKWKSPKEFGKLEISIVHRPKLDFCLEGNSLVPYVTLASRVYYCQFGKDQKRKRKENAKVKNRDHSYNTHDTQFRVLDSKKVGCQARVTIKEVLTFPHLQIAVNSTNHTRTSVGKRVRSNVEAGSKAFILSIPSLQDHSQHAIGKLQGMQMAIDTPATDCFRKHCGKGGIVCYRNSSFCNYVFSIFILPEDFKTAAGLCQVVDPTIVSKIKELVNEGMVDVQDVLNEDNNFVRESLHVPMETSNRRYYPTKKSVADHIRLAEKALGVSDDEQERVEKLLHDWQEGHPMDLTYLRKKSVGTDGSNQKFLMVFQTASMKRLLYRYGNSVTCLDATYKTSRYCLPLFFLAVPANFGFQVAAVFIPEDESVLSILEGLQIIKDANPTWSPTFTMTDNDEKEVQALERFFPEAHGLLCDFHRIQAWRRWLTKERVGESKEAILVCLKNLASATTEEEFNKRLVELKKKKFWEKISVYLEKEWLPKKLKWVQCYRRNLLLVDVHTNNGLERINRTLKYNFLKKRTLISLEKMLHTLIHKFLPSAFTRYIESNQNIAPGYGKTYNSKIPEYLHNRPPDFIKACMEKMELSKNCSSVEHGDDRFKVDGYTCYLGDSSSYPRCDCYYFGRKVLPCKHIFAAISQGGDKFDWDKLSSAYTKSYFYTCDTDVLYEAEKKDENIHKQESTIKDGQENGNNTSKDQTFVSDGNTNLLTMQKRVREILDLARSWTFTCTDVEQLESFYSKVRDSFKDAVPTNPKLPLWPTKKRLQLRKKHNLKTVYTEQNIASGKQEERGVKCVPMDSVVSADPTQMTIPRVHVNPSLPDDFVPEDYQDLCNEVKRIWTEHTEEIPNRLIGPYTITSQSILCVNSLLCDEVIDSFLHDMVSKFDGHKNEQIYHLNCIAMTGIFEGQQEIHHCLRRLPSLQRYDTIIGACNQGGCHWCLIIIRPKERRILFLNPLGTLQIQEQDIVLKWFKFLKLRFDAKMDPIMPEIWTLQIPKHARQSDGSSCGIYVLKFAENYLTGQQLEFQWSKDDVRRARLSLAVYLLSVSRPQLCSEDPYEQEVSPEVIVFDPKAEVVVLENAEKQNEGAKCDTEEKEDIAITSHLKKYNMREHRHKRKRPSFFYWTPKKRQREERFCICQKPDDGRKYWCCESCALWYHPECIGKKEEDEEVTFICGTCQV